jgi:hypothetical protein
MQRAKKHEGVMSTITNEAIPLTALFDPQASYDTFKAVLEKYHHQVSAIRIVMPYYGSLGQPPSQLTATAAHQYNIPAVARVESSMVVIPRGILPFSLDWCAENGVDRIQFMNGNIQSPVKAREAIALADERNLDVQLEVGGMPAIGSADGKKPESLINMAMTWLDCGALNLVADIVQPPIPGLEEHAATSDAVNKPLAELLARTFGLHTVMFKAPSERAQQALISHLGEEVHLCDVPLPQLESVETLRVRKDSTTSLKEETVVAVPGKEWFDRQMVNESY